YTSNITVSRDTSIDRYSYWEQISPLRVNSNEYFTHEARWLKWLEREFTDRKVRGSNLTSASRLPLSRLGEPGSIAALVLPSGGMIARHRKGLRREFTDRNIRGSKQTSRTRLLLSRFWQAGSISALIFSSGGMAVGHRKGAKAERFCSSELRFTETEY
ncbi:hypothetical protein CSKR_111842, partial [Clonorchis sinensis]